MRVNVNQYVFRIDAPRGKRICHSACSRCEKCSATTCQVDHLGLRPIHSRFLQIGGQVRGVRERPALRQHAARDELALDLGRREGQRHVDHQRPLAGGSEVREDGPLLDGAVGHWELPVRPRYVLEDVIHAVVGGFDAREERGPSRPGVRGDRGPQHALRAAVDERLEVGEHAGLEHRIEDPPVRTVPADQQHSRHERISLRYRMQCATPGPRSLGGTSPADQSFQRNLTLPATRR